MVRTIVRPDKDHIKLEIPKEYIGKDIEITYLPLEELNKDVPGSTKTLKEFWGILSAEKGEHFHDYVKKSREEWERNI